MKLKSIVLSVIMVMSVLSMAPVATAQEDAGNRGGSIQELDTDTNVTGVPGSGTKADPWRVSNLSELNMTMHNASTPRIKLVSNISASHDDINSSLPSDYWVPPEFNGTLDGNGYTIHDLYLRAGPKANYTDGSAGLIGGMDGKGKVHDLRFEDPIIVYNSSSGASPANIGTVAGWAEVNSTIDNVSVVDVTIRPIGQSDGDYHYIGGLVGYTTGSFGGDVIRAEDGKRDNGSSGVYITNVRVTGDIELQSGNSAGVIGSAYEPTHVTGVWADIHLTSTDGTYSTSPVMGGFGYITGHEMYYNLSRMSMGATPEYGSYSSAVTRSELEAGEVPYITTGDNAWVYDEERGPVLAAFNPNQTSDVGAGQSQQGNNSTTQPAGGTSSSIGGLGSTFGIPNAFLGGGSLLALGGGAFLFMRQGDQLYVE